MCLAHLETALWNEFLFHKLYCCFFDLQFCISQGKNCSYLKISKVLTEIVLTIYTTIPITIQNAPEIILKTKKAESSPHKFVGVFWYFYYYWQFSRASMYLRTLHAIETQVPKQKRQNWSRTESSKDPKPLSTINRAFASHWALRPLYLKFIVKKQNLQVLCASYRIHKLQNCPHLSSCHLQSHH